MEPKMAKRVPPLTAKQVENFRPTDRAELTDGLVPGLRLRATASGVRSWSFNIRGHDGERRRFEVGVGLGLAEARRAAEVIRAKVRLAKTLGSSQGSSQAGEGCARRSRHALRTDRCLRARAGGATAILVSGARLNAYCLRPAARQACSAIDGGGIHPQPIYATAPIRRPRRCAMCGRSFAGALSAVRRQMASQLP